MAKTLKHIHFLGIAGVMTAPLAVALKNQGYFITGSDQEKIFPPVSDLISDIPLNCTPIDRSIDLAIIGSSFLSFSRCVKDFDQINKLQIPFISATKYLAINLIKPNSVLIAGSFGKTTISALVAWILEKNNFHPNYFFGGQLIDNSPSIKFNSSDWSVTEADESINGLDTKAKFLYYPVKYLILTSVDWEHKESYANANDNLNAFRQLVKNIPPDGALIYNQNNPGIKDILVDCRGKTIPYSPLPDIDSVLVGEYNRENIASAFTFCRLIGLNDLDIKKAVSTFPGIKKRLEKIFSTNNIIFYNDFAQSAYRVKSAIKALKFSYPHARLKVYLEPRATFLQSRESLSGFSEIVSLIDDFVLGKISFSANLPSGKRVTANDWQKIFKDIFHYLPTNESIISYYSANLKPGDLLINFSSGGLDGLNNLKKVYNHIKL